MSPKNKVKSPKPELFVVGWMEYLALPDLGLYGIKAKLDTGARTSALHATDVEIFTKNTQDWVRFVTKSDWNSPDISLEAPVYDKRAIKNTSGVPQERIVIRTALQIADRTWAISVSLTDRSNMRLPMIVGRSALKRQNIAVHTRRTKMTAPKQGKKA